MENYKGLQIYVLLFATKLVHPYKQLHGNSAGLDNFPIFILVPPPEVEQGTKDFEFSFGWWYLLSV